MGYGESNKGDVFVRGTMTYADEQEFLGPVTIGRVDTSATASGVLPYGVAIASDSTELLLQTLDNTYAGFQFVDKDGTRIATLSADRTAHQLEFYVADTDLDTVSGDNQPAKIANFGAIGEYSDFDFYTTHTFGVDQQGSGGGDTNGLPSDELLLVYNSNSGNNIQERWTENGTNKFARVYDGGSGALRHYAYEVSTGTGYWLDVRPSSNEVEWANNWEHTNFTNETGTTANRPSSPAIGQQFFDTDLGQPIWYDGSGWVTADGTAA